ncbi:hypothetical protein [Micromonospora chersina]
MQGEDGVDDGPRQQEGERYDADGQESPCTAVLAGKAEDDAGGRQADGLASISRTAARPRFWSSRPASNLVCPLPARLMIGDVDMRKASAAVSHPRTTASSQGTKRRRTRDMIKRQQSSAAVRLQVADQAELSLIRRSF